jgi:phage terminase small subunit
VGKQDRAPDKQIIFAQEYITDFNGKQAAIRAGYSEKTAESQASRLLRNVKVRTEIEKLLEDPVGRRNETRERALKELEQIAYTDEGIDIRKDKDGNILEVSRKDKIKSLELLLRMHGLLSDSLKLTGSVGVRHNLSKLSDKELIELEKITGKIEEPADD